MSLRPVPRLDPRLQGSEPLAPSDLKRDLEQHVEAGFPVDLALDLVLNELVVRAASVMGATDAAIALAHDDELVIRAATGRHAPDLGAHLSMRDGLSGACVRTRTPQLSNDTDHRSVHRAIGIRSVLIVPVIDEVSALGEQAELVGVLEVLSSASNAFSESSEALLLEFARESASLRRNAAELKGPSSRTEDNERKPGEGESSTGEPVEVESVPAERELFQSFELADGDLPDPVVATRQPYQGWTIALASLVILAAIALSFMVGSRVGWLRALATNPPTPVSAAPAPVEAVVNPPAVAPEEPPPPPRKKKVVPAPPADPSTATMSASDQLVVYEKGKVVYRMKAQPLKSEGEAIQANAAQPPASSAQPPTPAEREPNSMASSVVAASSRQRLSDRVWLAPDQAASLLVSRVDPSYPPEALAAHHSGNVVLEVNVAEDGTVSSVRPLVGDPILAAAAAQAVRSWRYQPLRSHDQPSPFRTDVTLTFSLPN